VFKALLAASVAMLACCAAAVFAGPTPPLPNAEAPVSVSPGIDEALPLHLVSPDEFKPDSLDYDLSTSFMPMPLSMTYAGGSPSTVNDDDDDETPLVPPPPVQAAVIPLPSPLYAAVALLGVALIARRAMLRAC
jgi:hypothetical protein